MKSATAIVKMEEAQMALFDRASPANRSGHYLEARDKSWEFERKSSGAFKGAWTPEEREQAAERFEQYWALRQKAGELLAWMSGSGVFRVDVRVLPPGAPFPEADGAFLGGDGAGLRMSAPSGELMLASLAVLGSDGAPLLTVSPGVYRAALSRDLAQLRKHHLTPRDAPYPEGDGPDYLLTLQEDAPRA